MRSVLICLIGLFAGLAVGADPAEPHFTLRLPDLSDLTDYQLSGGGRVLVPVGRKIRSLQFVLTGSAARHLGAGRVAVKVNGKAIDDVVVAMQGSTLLATVQSTDDDGFVPAGARVNVEAYGMRNNEYRQTWVLRQGKSSFLREAVGETEGAPLDINIEEPDRAILIHADDSELEVEVKGSVAAEIHSLTINGAPATFQLKNKQASFATKAKVLHATKRLEIRAQDKAGSSCTVWVPVRSMKK